MQQPASLSVSAPPAPVITSHAAPPLPFSDVRRVSLCAVMDDFSRAWGYKQRVRHLRATGGAVTVIATSEAAVKAGETRLLKEHSSAAWSVYFYQWSLFGLTGISSVAAAMGFYLTIYHNRMFLPVGPMAAAVTWRLWDLLEAAWEQQRYIENAAQLRDARKGNPMNLVAKRTSKRDGSGEKDEPAADLI